MLIFWSVKIVYSLLSVTFPTRTRKDEHSSGDRSHFSWSWVDCSWPEVTSPRFLCLYFQVLTTQPKLNVPFHNLLSFDVSPVFVVFKGTQRGIRLPTLDPTDRVTLDDSSFRLLPTTPRLSTRFYNLRYVKIYDDLKTGTLSFTWSKS